MLRVVYLSPILIEENFRAPCTRVTRSDQIEGTEATRGPRRPKGLVMVTHGQESYPAAGSWCRTLEAR